MVFIAVATGMIFSATVGFEAGQATPDTENLFTSIAEKNERARMGGAKAIPIMFAR